MELSALESGYSGDFVGLHSHHVSDDVVSTTAPVQHVSAPVSPASKLHYSDAGPHREMAVDCPANFVGVKKGPPRLPRPLSNVMQTGSASSMLKGSQTSLSSPGKSYPAADSSLGVGVHYQQSTALQPGDPLSTSSSDLPFTRDERDRSERLRRYQEELAKRREMEERMNQEQEQLRASLRGSKKMQGLEEKRTRTNVLAVQDGFDNPMYRADDGDGRTWQHKKQSQSNSVQQDHHIEHMNVHDVVMSVQQAKHCLLDATDKEELGRVLHFVTSERFQRVLKLHNKLVSVSLQSPEGPGDHPALMSLYDAVMQSATRSNNQYANELYHILAQAHFKSLIYAYDESIQQDVVHSKSVENKDERQYLYERASQYGDENIKIVRLQKTADPLGATVKNEGDTVIIGRIVKGGVAEKSGLLHEGDEILEINGVEIRSMSINDVCDMMSRWSGVLTFLINPAPDQALRIAAHVEMNVRALFSYDPEEDNLIPCRELGILFKKGDILHVINQCDSNWWQAYREGEDDQTLAGLIPSKQFHENREKLRLIALKEHKDRAEKKFRCRCRKKMKRTYDVDEKDIDADKILSYEEVSRYNPQPNRKRPIILIGPPNVGRQELRQRLMESDPDRFAAAVPHTSRPMSEGELNGREYHFISKHEFEADVAEGRFVEYGEHEKQLFGTSMDSIRQVVNSGKVCVLNFHPQSMQILKKSDVRPYFIFIAPGSIAKLKQMREQQGVTVTDEQLQAVIDKAREMENNHGHMFDYDIVNQDLDRAYDELLKEINRLEVEPQWVPTSWLT